MLECRWHQSILYMSRLNLHIWNLVQRCIRMSMYEKLLSAMSFCAYEYINTSYHFVNINPVIPVYCDPASAPTLANAYTSVPSTTLGSTTSFICLPGYTFSSTSAPYYSCNVGGNGINNGSWSTVIDSCVGESLTILIYLSIMK